MTRDPYNAGSAWVRDRAGNVIRVATLSEARGVEQDDFGTTFLAQDLDPDATTVYVGSPIPTALLVDGQCTVACGAELMLVTAGAATTTWTVTRGVEGTTAASHAGGATVAHVLTAAGLLTSVYVDVRVYGATGNGTTDDTTAIQAAIDATPSGATLYFPAGIYAISATLHAATAVRILGDGTEYRGSTILMTATDTGALSFDEAVSAPNFNQASAVEHMRVLSWVSHAGGGPGIYALADVHVRNCEIRNFYDGVALGADSNFSRVDGCSFVGCVRAGVHLATVNNFSVTRSTFWNGAYGVHATNVEGLRVRDCAFEINSVAGIYADGGYGAAVIEGNYFEATTPDTATNIILGATTEIRAVTIKGNVFDSTGASAPHIQADKASRITLDTNFYRGSAAEISTTADTSAVLFVNNPHLAVTALPVSTSVIDPGPFTTRAYERDVLATPDLVGYWPLEEWSGTAAVDLVMVNQAGYVASPTLGAVGPLAEQSRAVTLNGSTQSVQADATVVGDQVTWEVWAKFTGAPSDAGLFGESNAIFGSMLYADAALLYFMTQSSNINVAFPGDAAWHQYAGVYDGTNSTLYIDGAVVAGPTAKSAAAWPFPSVPIEIGSWNNGAGGNFPGSVSHASYYSRALTTAEILRHYRIGSGT